MESVDVFKNLQKRLYEMLVSDDIVDKWAKTHVWQTEMGDKTVDVYPVTIWDDCAEIKVNTNRNYFTKAIERLVDVNDELESGEFLNGVLRFYYTDFFSKEVARIRKNINGQIQV